MYFSFTKSTSLKINSGLENNPLIKKIPYKKLLKKIPNPVRIQAAIDEDLEYILIKSINIKDKYK
jgi:hypothetical protein